MSRPDWDGIWMRLARDISGRSHDPRNKVAALVVTEDNSTVLGLGYNGDARGGKNVPDSMEPGMSGFVHAEANCLLKFNFGDHRKKKMYVTLSPCPVCARMIINAYIDEVVYDEEYRDTAGLDILKEAGVKVRKFS